MVWNQRVETENNDGYTLSKKNLASLIMLCKWSKYFIYNDKYFIHRYIGMLLADNLLETQTEEPKIMVENS